MRVAIILLTLLVMAASAHAADVRNFGARGDGVANDTDATHHGFQLQLGHGTLRRSMKGGSGGVPVLPKQ